MATRKLKVLAISDTHLGEETSLLSFPRGLQHLWQTFADTPDFWKPIFPDYDHSADRVEVEELVLMGDIPDSTLSSTSQISAGTHAFAMMLSSALAVKRAVYVPGNHDHTLWSNYLKASERRRSSAGGNVGRPEPVVGITEARGEPIVAGGKGLDSGANEILSVFLGYPIGWAWWHIKNHPEERFEFRVSNPLYATEVAGRTYVFAHGTHFRPELASAWKKGALNLADFLGLDQLLHLEFEQGADLGEAENMEDLERRVAPFVDALWPSSKNKPTSRSDELWYLMTLFREGPEEGRTQPEGSQIFPSKHLFSGTAEDRVDQLTDERYQPLDKSLERFREYFLSHLRPHLESGGLWHGEDRVTFVYGDTHRGGFGDLAPSSEGGPPVRVYNTGAWVVPAGGGHPASYLFAVDEGGEEYLIDMVFDKEKVKVGDDPLIDLASKDVEHRLEAVGEDVRALGGVVRFFKDLW